MKSCQWWVVPQSAHGNEGLLLVTSILVTGTVVYVQGNQFLKIQWNSRSFLFFTLCSTVVNISARKPGRCEGCSFSGCRGYTRTISRNRRTKHVDCNDTVWFAQPSEESAAVSISWEVFGDPSPAGALGNRDNTIQQMLRLPVFFRPHSLSSLRLQRF